MALASCPARQGQQRSLRRMRQVLSWALARSPGRGAGHELGWPPSGRRACSAPVRSADVLVLADVALVGQDDQPAGGQLPHDAPDPGRGQVMHGAGQRPGHPHDVPVGAGDDLQVHPVLAVLAGVERPVGGDPVDGD